MSRKSRGVSFAAWLVDPNRDMRDLVKSVPLTVWSEGYLDNLTMKETEDRYHEKRHGNINSNR